MKRAEKLKAEDFPKTNYRGGSYKEGVKIDLERARLITEAYKETEGEPMVLVRAKVARKILENMTIYIQDGELIVGNYAPDKFSLPYTPDYSNWWVDVAVSEDKVTGIDERQGLLSLESWQVEEQAGRYRHLLDEKGKKELYEMLKYWRGKSADDRVMDVMPEEGKHYVWWNGATWSGFAGLGEGTAVPNFDKLFKVGMNGLVNEIEKRLNELKICMPKGISVDDYIDQRRNLEAMLIAIEAYKAFAVRYANLADKLARETNDKKRKAELKGISEVCNWIAGNPPRTFHEALQLFYFAELIVYQIVTIGTGMGVRFDQIFYPFYKKDIKDKKITKEEAQELMECLWVKFDSHGRLLPPLESSIESGARSFVLFDIGGVNKDGNDATNELSYLVLDTAASIRTLQPMIAIRYHKNIPPDFVEKAIEVVSLGMGYPAFYNDGAYIPHIMRHGIPLEDARDYGVSSCVYWTIPGKVNHVIFPEAGVLSALKCFEIVLYQGKDKFTGAQIGYPTPDPTTFTSIEDVMEAYFTQMRFMGEKLGIVNKIAPSIFAQYMQQPFLSVLLDGCIEKGKDCTQFTTYPNYSGYAILGTAGTTNVADSLAAIKKLVFEEKKITMAELVDACRNNFEGKEALRQMLINDAPKFGNDDPYVDDIAREVHVRSNEEVMKATDYFGTPLRLDGSIGGGYFSLSLGTGATPDGRLDRSPSADSSVAPTAGFDKKGPTAVLRSIAKAFKGADYCPLFNQKFSPVFLKGENKKLFAGYLKTWADSGLSHIQFNVVDKETLIDGQVHPEKHEDLMVRVAGFSAYWTYLSQGIQDDIIKRTEHTCV